MTAMTALPDLLDALHDRLTALHAALRGAQDRLAGADPAAITAAAGTIRGALERLQQAEETRRRWLDEQGETDMDAALARSGDAAARRRWTAIVELTRECQHLGAFSGALTERQIRQTRRALDLLHGRAPDATTYGRRGEDRPDRQSHSLTTA